MSYKDALTLYEELVATGTEEGQAKAMAHQMSSLSDEMGGRYNELSARLDKRLDSIDSNLKWMMIVGGVMAASFFSNVLFIKLG
jgi:flagellar biosynthesis/type III secretory pathway protein FliH